MTWQEKLAKTFDNTTIDVLKGRAIGQLLTEIETKFNQYKQENLRERPTFRVNLKARLK